MQAESYEKRITFYLAIERMLTPRQRAAVLGQLQNYIDNFQRLAEYGKRVSESR
jgi:Spy/CpxP family protein refolding chaperone